QLRSLLKSEEIETSDGIIASPYPYQTMSQVTRDQIEVSHNPGQTVPFRRHNRLHHNLTLLPSEEARARQDKDGVPQGAIAIIGVAGRYPQARDLQAFWENLRTGRDCITEIPPERWDHRLYFDADKDKPGTTYSKWGGFLEGVDEFDPLFFN